MSAELVALISILATAVTASRSARIATAYVAESILRRLGKSGLAEVFREMRELGLAERRATVRAVAAAAAKTEMETAKIAADSVDSSMRMLREERKHGAPSLTDAEDRLTEAASRLGLKGALVFADRDLLRKLATVTPEAHGDGSAAVQIGAGGQGTVSGFGGVSAESISGVSSSATVPVEGVEMASSTGTAPADAGTPDTEPDSGDVAVSPPTGHYVRTSAGDLEERDDLSGSTTAQSTARAEGKALDREQITLEKKVGLSAHLVAESSIGADLTTRPRDVANPDSDSATPD